MKSTDQSENEFVDAAADNLRRKAKIQELTQKREKLSLGAWISTACGLAMGFIEAFANRNDSAIVAMALFSAAMIWIQLFKCESDLRLLKLVDKLKE